MSIFRNDKVILIKEMGNMKTVGQTYEIANITDTAIIIRDAVSKIAVGAVDIDDFSTYFKKPREVKVWTPWVELKDREGLVGFYRTNNKKVQVRIDVGEKIVRSEAACNLNEDDFNLLYGIKLAYARCQSKILKEGIDYHQTIINQLCDNLKDNTALIHKLTN